MANARKCDRCGELYENYDRSTAKGKGNSIMVTNVDSDRSYWPKPLLDLCPECMDEFEAWLRDTKVKKKAASDADQSDSPAAGQTELLIIPYKDA